MKRIVTLCLFTILVTQTAAAGRFIQRTGSLPDVYIVRMENDLPASAADMAHSLARSHGLQVTNVYTSIFKGFAFRGSEAAARALARNPHVRYVQDAVTAKLTGTQTPAPSWGLDRVDQRLLPANNSYTYPETGAGSLIYIVDTGVNPVGDLAGRIGTHVNYVPTENRTDDCHDHGTSVAVIAAGTTFGVAKGATIMNYRAFNCQGDPFQPSLLQALEDINASHNPGSRVIVNLSWRIGWLDDAINDAVTSMTNNGLVVVTAAGGGYVDSCTITPAILGGSVAGVITVSSSMSNDTFDGSAGVGTCVDILAPSNVQTLNANGQQIMFSGTSASTPHVAGALALLHQRHSVTNPAQLEQILKQNASPGVVQGVPANTANLLLHTLPSVPVSAGTSLMYASDTTTASVTPVAGATYTWTVFNGTLTGGQGTPTATFRAGCADTMKKHAGASVAVTTGSGTTTGITAVSLVRPKAKASGQQTIQSGQSATVSANLFGVAPWYLVWSDDFMQTTSSTPASHTVSPTSTTYYSVVAMQDAYGCYGTTEGFATVNVQ